MCTRLIAFFLQPASTGSSLRDSVHTRAATGFRTPPEAVPLLAGLSPAEYQLPAEVRAKFQRYVHTVPSPPLSTSSLTSASPTAVLPVPFQPHHAPDTSPLAPILQTVIQIISIGLIPTPPTLNQSVCITRNLISQRKLKRQEPTLENPLATWKVDFLLSQ